MKYKKSFELEAGNTAYKMIGDCLYTMDGKTLVTKIVTAEETAVNFFTSEEYALKNNDSETFVTDLYSVFMDREADFGICQV